MNRVKRNGVMKRKSERLRKSLLEKAGGMMGFRKGTSGKVTALIKLAAEFIVEQNRFITSCR